jgi:hypothetical protein
LFIPVIIILLLFSIFIFSKNYDLLSIFNTKYDNNTETELKPIESEEPSQKMETAPQNDENTNNNLRCGAAGIAAKVTKYLREMDIDVVGRDNYKNFKIKDSFVIDRVDNRERAIEVAESLGLNSANIQLIPDSNLQLDVTIVLGSDYKNLTPFK